MTMAWRIFIASWKHFGRNLWIGLATIVVFTMALLSVNVLLGANAIAERVVKLLEDRIDVTVTFQPNTPDGVLNQARFYLASLDQTQSAELITADQALEAFKKRNANNPKILEALGEVSGNPLGAQLIIKAKHPEDYPFLQDVVRGPQYAQFVRTSSYDDHKQAIAQIQQAGDQIRLFASALVAIFILFGLLAAFNAIRVAIYTQREEIAIMRLVGASSAFIRMPFVLEGVWIALIASLLTVLIVWGGVTVLDPKLMQFFDGLDTGLTSFFVANAPILVLAEVGGLCLLSASVSWIAVGRYIKR